MSLKISETLFNLTVYDIIVGRSARYTNLSNIPAFSYLRYLKRLKEKIIKKISKKLIKKLAIK